MARYSLQFFATAEEQAALLQNYLCEENAWAWIQHTRPPGSLMQISAREVRATLFHTTGEDALVLFLGDSRLTEWPVFSTHGMHRQVDFLRSMVVQFVPAIASGRILLEGQVGVSQRGYYTDVGIDPEPVFQLFASVRTRLRALKDPNAVLIQKLVQGGQKEWSDVIVTRGAVEWSRSGGELKQFVAGPVVFHVAEHRAASRSS